VLVMTVNPGFGGQSMIPYTLDKVRRLRALLAARNLDIPIEVDGGVNAGTLTEVVTAGADILVMGAAVFAGGTSIADAMSSFRRQIAALQV
jgi:ribulose-phosphate 3-epimerase